ncbi:hypothetical protein PGT21_013999 [Puccinia graminis f. sp. tritici]|uniref:Uncharacterized protein n=1 Tax=Puccinia graminis f. sp. tritici TaxID=56615 RepID=A0A5B0NU90_PUCGR|nr:hypothetical protein PGT21_013999 [Puccinia graminis f. sp. tritici]
MAVATSLSNAHPKRLQGPGQLFNIRQSHPIVRRSTIQLFENHIIPITWLTASLRFRRDLILATSRFRPLSKELNDRLVYE